MDLGVQFHTEYEKFPVSSEHDAIVMVSLECPPYESQEQAVRAPMDVCCVLDKSGSMAEGNKLELLKAAMVYMVDQLKRTDRMTIITFDSDVEVVVRLKYATAENKPGIKDAIRAIRPGSQTNLSGALFEALQLFRTRTEVLDVSSVLVFTDGVANHGITTCAMFTKGIENSLRDLPTCSIYTFGFGTEHDAALLRTIADTGNGMYCYISQEDEIPQAFGDCLGGLISIFAQNLKLDLKTSEHVKIKSVLSKYPKLLDESRHVQLRLGDMASEDRKDLLFELTMSSTAESCDSFPLAEAVVSYFEVPRAVQGEKRGQFTVQRVTGLEKPANGDTITPNVVINRQRNRIEATKALEQANTLAREEKYQDARRVVQAAIAFIENSVTAQEPFCVALVTDLKTTLAGLESRASYTTHGGDQYLNTMLNSHSRQRGTATCYSNFNPQRSIQSYATASRSLQRTIAATYMSPAVTK